MQPDIAEHMRHETGALEFPCERRVADAQARQAPNAGLTARSPSQAKQRRSMKRPRVSNPAASMCYAQCKAGRRAMPIGMFRSEEGWVQVDYGTGNIPIPRSKYEENRYKPDYDKLPTEAEYLAAEKKKEDDAKGS